MALNMAKRQTSGLMVLARKTQPSTVAHHNFELKVSIVPKQGKIWNSINAEFSIFLTKNVAISGSQRPWNTDFHGV
jgi:hypothetical protein